jgi:dipeptidyl aminopeptidase/acylaminoacyl peptidase
MKRALPLAGLLVIAAFTTATSLAQAPSPPASAALRPMTFLDMQLMRNAGSPTPSPDGQWMLYTISTPDWKEARRQTDIHLVSLKTGLPSTRQLTFTTEKNETSPAWLRDGRAFVFLSNRDAPSNATTQNQIFLMRPDGGESRRVTDAREGVADFQLSPDGTAIVYRSGQSGQQQLFRLAVDAVIAASAPAAGEQVTKQAAGIDWWDWAPDSRRIYFVTPNAADPDEKARRDKRFTVNIRNQDTPLASLWAVDLNPLRPAPGETQSGHRPVRLTEDQGYSVTGVTISRDGKWIGFRGLSPNRYHRNITQANLYSDLYLFEVATKHVERLTRNAEVGEGALSFSPDSGWVAFSAPDNLERYTMTNQRVYLRRVADRGKPFRKLGGAFDGDVSVGFWSNDAVTIYFNEGIKATNQLFALDVDKDTVRQLTREAASLSIDRDDDSGVLLITYTDGRTPSTIFTVASIDQAGTRSAWRQLTDVNPQVRGFALGDQEEITWKSKDGRMVGGVLVKPVGFKPGQRYPLIVAIHGGPASADVLGFNGGYGSQVYAGAGYVVLRPNYRGSTNYGHQHKNDIVGNYFAPGYDDIISGVDHLIAQGIADPDRMGALGWSAGGHWSNWILVTTDRFKAISSGAGTSNWISMYAQSDVQRNRQFYLGDKLPYDDFDAYWNQSPLKYIRRAKTPTMIHVVEGDPRVPSPQSVELHMALKQLGVPTELFMYPGSTHGIPDPRNQLVKAVAEMAWMDYYVRGKGEKFNWRMVLATLEDAK